MFNGRVMWVKSSFSFANGNCVEVAFLPDGNVGVRNSRDLIEGVLVFTPGEWKAFMSGVYNDEFHKFGERDERSLVACDLYSYVNRFPDVFQEQQL
jgi:hypothetical protein